MQRTIDAYHEQLLSFWRDNQSSSILGFSRVPHFGQLPKAGRTEIKVLFLGLNPSYVESTLERHWRTVHEGNQRLLDMGLQALQWDAQRSAEDWLELRAAIVALDHFSRDNYGRYFDAIASVAEEVGVGENWHHLDAFPLRETSQNALIPFLPVFSEAPAGWQPVLEGLLNATMTLVATMKPKVVVVANSHVAKVLEHRLPLTLQENGHRYENESASFEGVPFLLSSQLSGGATSKYGRQRLVADLRDALRDGKGLNGGATPVAPF